MIFNSAIFQMLMGIHGNVDTIIHSKDYYDAYEKYYRLYKKFTERFSNNEDIISMINDMNNSMDEVAAYGETDFHISGFSFGVLMGIDIMRINSPKNN